MSDERKTEPDSSPPSAAVDEAKHDEEAAAKARPAPTVIDDRATEDEPAAEPAAPAARPGNTHIAGPEDGKSRATKTLDGGGTTAPQLPPRQRSRGRSNDNTLLFAAVGLVIILGIIAIIVVTSRPATNEPAAKTGHASASPRATSTQQAAAPTNAQEVEAPPPNVANQPSQPGQPTPPSQPVTPGPSPAQPGTAPPGTPTPQPAWIPTVLPSTLPPFPSAFPNVLPSSLPPIPSTFPMPQQPPP